MSTTRKRYTTEQIIHKLREAVVELAKGKTVAQACQQLGVQKSLAFAGRAA